MPEIHLFTNSCFIIKMVIKMRLNDLRLRAKLTQDQVASAIGVTRATVGNWETGRYTPDLNTVIALSKYFGVSVDYLIGNSNEVLDQLSQSEQKLIMTIRKNKINIKEMQEFADYKASSKK